MAHADTHKHHAVGFCEVLREQVSVHSKGQKAVEETLRICREMNYLVPFLTERAAEVEATMMTIFSQEYATAMFEKTTREEGRAEGKLSQAFESAKLMLKAGKLQLSEVLSFFPVLTSQDVKRLQEEVTPA